MANNNNKIKIAVFGTVVVVAVVLIIGLIVHRSLYRDRICKDKNFLFYENPITNLSSCEYRAKERGPCGENMVMTLDKKDPSRGIGVCECDTESNARALIYHEETNQCYFIFTQAYCEAEEWLTVLAGKGPVCDTRLCDEPDGSREMVPLHDGRCVELGKHDNVTCNSSEIIQFHRRKKWPSCKQGLGTSIGSVGVPATDCPQGYFSTGVGHCQPDFDFD